MRNAFIQSLLERADDRTFLLTGDVGYSVVEPFSERFPHRYRNCGVMEQAMTGFAAGLALGGHKVFTYSIANFNTLRALEQIRNDVCYHDLDVTIVSVGGGFVYGSAGYSHHAVQDIGMLGSLPNMTLLLPAHAGEVRTCMEYAFKQAGPKYLRLGKNDGADKNPQADSAPGFHVYHSDSADLVIVTAGGILDVALAARSILAAEGIRVSVYSCPVVGESFADDVQALGIYAGVLTLEEGLATCGFGAMVQHALQDLDTTVVSMGAVRDLASVVGSQSYLRTAHGLTPERVAAKVKGVLDGQT